jgi:hypothetical protein
MIILKRLNVKDLSDLARLAIHLGYVDAWVLVCLGRR